MSWLSGKTSYKSANMGEDHKKEGGTTNSSSHKKNNYTKTTTFTAPTTGLEDVFLTMELAASRVNSRTMWTI